MRSVLQLRASEDRGVAQNPDAGLTPGAETNGATPPTRFRDPQIEMAHGAGGKASRRLVDGLFAPLLYGPESAGEGDRLSDAARVAVGGTAVSITTDSFVVTPLQFPGGSIGELAVNGTVNDLAVSGARPVALVTTFVLEAGLPTETLASLVRATRRATTLPLLVKLSPNVTHVAEMARVCEAEGADGVTLINSVQALEVDVERRRPVLSNVLGGLSGPAIRPIALRMVWQTSRAVRIPICGVGGIASADDAVKFLLCGASAVQVGTQNYLDPTAAASIADGIAAYAARHGFPRVRDLIGALELPAT
jgi:hypothetical protein